jgi:hypothetical protein
MKQSATNARMDALNIWYGGELEHHQAMDAAGLQRYNQLIAKSNQTGDIFGSTLGAGTQALMGTTSYLKTGQFLPGVTGGTF